MRHCDHLLKKMPGALADRGPTACLEDSACDTIVGMTCNHTSSEASNNPQDQFLGCAWMAQISILAPVLQHNRLVDVGIPQCAAEPGWDSGA